MNNWEYMWLLDIIKMLFQHWPSWLFLGYPSYSFLCRQDPCGWSIQDSFGREPGVYPYFLGSFYMKKNWSTGKPNQIEGTVPSFGTYFWTQFLGTYPCISVSAKSSGAPPSALWEPAVWNFPLALWDLEEEQGRPTEVHGPHRMAPHRKMNGEGVGKTVAKRCHGIMLESTMVMAAWTGLE